MPEGAFRKTVIRCGPGCYISLSQVKLLGVWSKLRARRNDDPCARAILTQHSLSLSETKIYGMLIALRLVKELLDSGELRWPALLGSAGRAKRLRNKSAPSRQWAHTETYGNRSSYVRVAGLMIVPLPARGHLAAGSLPSF